MVESIVRIGEIVASNFSFSHNVFHRYISLVRQNTTLCGTGLTHSHTMTPFDASGKQDF